jgi:predicted AAA+ superfamily ATPase
LLCHLLKITKTESLLINPFKGALFENMMIAEYVKQKHHCNSPEDLWFWRDSGGNEIDLLVDKGDEIEIFEFKASKTIKTEMFDGLNKFEEISQIQNLKKYLVYGGNESQQRTAGRLLSWKDFG